jgi:hypothetical protein
MPALTPKALADYPDDISQPWKQALESPRKIILAAEGVSMQRAKYLHARLKAARAGLQVYYDRDHEYHRASVNNHLHIRNEAYPGNAELRNVKVWYEGMIKRPSEEAAEWMAELIRKRQSGLI